MATIYTLEDLRKEAEEMIPKIRKMSDQEKKCILHDGECFSPAELIEDLLNLTPRGVYYAELHRKEKQTLAAAKATK